jgi:sugar-specific transcriptional regulator TrmB
MLLQMDKAALLHAIEGTGLAHKAAAIYLSLLGKRKMTISDIARESGMKRATCYEYVDGLLAKDFIVRVPVGKRMYYSAVGPKKILGDFRKKTALFEEQLPEMLKIHDEAIQRPKISFYEGKRELRRIYDDLFKTMGEVSSIFPPAVFFENFTEEDYDEFDKSIGEHAIKSRDLFVSDKFYKKIQEIRKKNPGAKLDKKLPKWFHSNVDVLIYSEKVALISLRDLSAIVIENKDIAELFRNFHTGLWKLT